MAGASALTFFLKITIGDRLLVSLSKLGHQ